MTNGNKSELIHIRIETEVKSNLEKILFLFIFLISILFILSGCSFENNHFSFAISKIKDESGVIISDNCDMVYYCDDGKDFGPGRSPMYAVFLYESEPTDFLEQYEFSNIKNEEFERSLNQSLDVFIETFNVSIPIDYCIDFSKEYSFLNFQNTGVYLVYFIKEKMLTTYVTAA